jgi:hypothetical protein
MSKNYEISVVVSASDGPTALKISKFLQETIREAGIPTPDEYIVKECGGKIVNEGFEE